MLHKIKTKYQQHRLKRAQKREDRKRQLDQIRSTPSDYDHAHISWVASEAVIHERGPVWKVIMSIVVFLSIIGGIYYGAWTFSLAIAAFATVYAMVHLQHPKAIEIKISEIGIKVGYRKYAYSQIRAFWILYDLPYVATLNIRVSGQIVDDITIQLGNQSPAEVREFLMTKIPELEGQSEKLSDIILRLFKI
ncbi:MAG: hypothetical protein NTZ25_00595 [Candidatus Peregrinibacteria bacterium]|nr:hypothetical protein [Candidatus Peregrinibacteria bacterium]